MRWGWVTVVGMTACVEAPEQTLHPPMTSGPAEDDAPTTGGPDEDALGPGLDVGSFDPGPPTIAEIPPLPIHGGTLHTSRNGVHMFAGDPARDLVHVVDVEAHTLTATIERPGCVPGRLVDTADGRLLFLCRGEGTLVAADPETGDVLDVVHVCGNPRGLAADIDTAWVACAEGLILEIGDGGVISRLEIDRELRDVVDVGPPLRVSTFRFPSILTLDPDGTIAATVVPPVVAVRNQRETLPWDPQEEPAFDVVGPLEPNVARHTVGTAAGGWAMVHQVARADEDGVPLTTDWGGVEGCVGSQNAAVSWIAPEHLDPVSQVFPGMGVVFDAAFDLEGGRIAVVGAVQEQWALVLHDLEPIGSFTVVNPCEPVGTFRLDGLPTSAAFDASGTPWVLLQEPSELLIFGGGDDWPTRIALSDHSVHDSGHELFHRPTTDGIACVSCHPEGRDDGRMWALDGEEKRRTLSLAGRLEGGAPFHWNGEFDTLAELDATVRVETMGGPPLDEAWVAAFERWLFSIPPMRHADVQDDALAEVGAQRFEELGCAGCHVPPRYDKPGSVGVAGVAPLQVPSLLGVRYGSPYMHDGRADDLEAALDDMLLHATAPVEVSDEVRAELLAFLGSL